MPGSEHETSELDLRDAGDRSPMPVDEVRRRVAEPGAPVLVDFDHTLCGANSTELFISSCKPSLLIALIDFLVRGCVPWRVLGSPRSYRVRDYACVLAIVVVTPWNLLLWRRQAPALFARHEVPEMADLLRPADPARLLIISFGMTFVIRGLLRGSRYETTGVLATPLRSAPSRFSTGKVPIATAALGEDGLARAVFFSDSTDDLDLLVRCGTGLLLTPQGERNLAREHLYVPMRYTARVKYSPGYTLDQLLLVDAVVIGIAVSQGLTSLLHFAVIAPLMILSVMSVYEIGYFENDMHASKSEKKPVLGPRVARFRTYPLQPGAWVWATLLAAGGLGVAVLLGELNRDEVVGAALRWAVLLIAVRAAFFGYNRLRTEARIFAYPVLQVLKYAGIFLVFLPTLLGVVLVVSQVLAMWIIYVIYRVGGRTKSFDHEAFRTFCFLLTAGLLLLTGNLAADDPSGSGPSPTQVCFAATVVWSLARISKVPLMRRVGRG